MISWRNVQQSSDRIARTLINAPVCRTFLRSVSLWVIDRQELDTDRYHKCRPPGNEPFRRTFPRKWSPRSMRALLFRPLPMGS
jgi:hypothetical protein